MEKKKKMNVIGVCDQSDLPQKKRIIDAAMFVFIGKDILNVRNTVDE